VGVFSPQIERCENGDNPDDVQLTHINYSKNQGAIRARIRVQKKMVIIINPTNITQLSRLPLAEKGCLIQRWIAEHVWQLELLLSINAPI